MRISNEHFYAVPPPRSITMVCPRLLQCFGRAQIHIEYITAERAASSITLEGFVSMQTDVCSSYRLNKLEHNIGISKCMLRQTVSSFVSSPYWFVCTNVTLGRNGGCRHPRSTFTWSNLKVNWIVGLATTLFFRLPHSFTVRERTD